MIILRTKNAFLLILSVLLMSHSESIAQNQILNEDSIITNRWHSKRVQKDLWVKLRKQSEVNPVFLSANQLWWLRTKGFDFIPDYDWSNVEINRALANAKGNNVLPTILQYGGIAPILMGAIAVAFGYPETGGPILFGGAVMSITGTVISFDRRIRLKKEKRRIKRLQGLSQ